MTSAHHRSSRTLPPLLGLHWKKTCLRTLADSLCDRKLGRGTNVARGTLNRISFTVFGHPGHITFTAIHAIINLEHLRTISVPGINFTSWTRMNDQNGTLEVHLVESCGVLRLLDNFFQPRDNVTIYCSHCAFLYIYIYAHTLKISRYYIYIYS